MGWREDTVIQQASASPPGNSSNGIGQPAWQSDPIVTAGSQIDFDQPQEKVRSEIAKLPEAQRGPTLKAWADHFVAKERKGDRSMLDRGTDYIRDMATGTPVGSWLNEGNAAFASGVHRVTGGRAGAPYDEAMAYHEARDRAADKDSTVVGKIPLTNIDVNTGDLRKVAGGIASVPVSPVVNAFRGATMLPQMGNALMTGLGYGALYGAGQGDGVTNRLMEAGKGAAIAGPLGVAAVPAARALSNAVGYTADRFRPIPQPLQQYERGAVNALARSTTDDALAPRYAQQAADLGPEGMLADMGPNLRGQAGAIANQPGAGQQMVSRALHDRRDGAAGRISADVDNALGPAANMPETLEATRRAYAQQAAPHRQQFQQNPVPFTQPLDDTLQLLAQHEPGVIRAAQRLSGVDNQSGPQQWFARQQPDGTYQIERVPNASEWDYIKRAIDGMANGASASNNDRRIYGDLARRVRGQVDEALSPGAPQDSPWARARALEAEDFQMREAADLGRSTFDRGQTPDQLRAELFGVGQPPRGGMNPPQAAAHMLGARDQVRSIMGNASTAHGENAAAAARSKLGSDYAREKIDILAGPGAGGQLTRRLDAETVFDQTRQGVLGNSATAARQAAQAEFPNAAARQDAVSEIGKKALTGLAAEYSIRLANALSGSAITESRARVARDAAEMLIAQGQARDNVANAIFAYSQSRALSQANRARLARLAMAIAEGGRQKAVESKRSEPRAPAAMPTIDGRNALMLPDAPYPRLMPPPQ